MIASVSKTSKIVVEKSTVPVKTAEAIEKVCVVFERQRDLPLQPLSACRTVDRWMRVLRSLPCHAGAAAKLRGCECPLRHPLQVSPMPSSAPL